VIADFNEFSWLITSKYGRQHLDIYIPSIKLAIEYDGEQHFKPVCFGGIDIKKAQANLIQTKRLDRRKNNCIKSHPEDITYFIRFNYKEPLTEEYVKEKLIKSGIILLRKENNNDQI
jgi:very-short-patch-repair endonuclease